MAINRTLTTVTAGTNATAVWANTVYTDLGNVYSDKTVYSATDGTTITFNLNNGSIQTVTLGGNRTLALSNDVDGRSFLIILKQDATGSRTVTWWSNILWAYSVTPVLTTTASKYDVFMFIRIGSNYLGFIIDQSL